MFINYKKLAKEINHNNLTEKVAELIANQILSDEKFVEDIVKNLEVRYSDNIYTYIKSKPLKSYVADEVAQKLIPEVYALKRAEVLKEISSQGILNILQSNLETQAKQHLLNFITNKPENY